MSSESGGPTLTRLVDLLLNRFSSSSSQYDTKLTSSEHSAVYNGSVSVVQIVHGNPTLSIPINQSEADSVSASKTIHKAQTGTAREGESTGSEDSVDGDAETEPHLILASEYISLLSKRGLGHPLWFPGSIPGEMPREGGRVQIGDLGVLCSDSSLNESFRPLFNLCEPALRLEQTLKEVPVIFERFAGDLKGKSIRLHGRNHCIKSANIQVKLNVDGGSLATWHFLSTESKGAILMLPQGSSRTQIDNTYDILEYAKRRCQHWWSYILQNWKFGGQENIYLVTGFCKCSSWGIAVYTDADDKNEIGLSFTSKKSDGTLGCYWGPNEDDCLCDPRADVKCHPASDSDQPSIPLKSADEDQYIFIKGFFITHSTATTSRPKWPPPHMLVGLASSSHDVPHSPVYEPSSAGITSEGDDSGERREEGEGADNVGG